MEEKVAQDQSLIKRVVICGPESTGKSTMTRNLAAHFKTNFVDEFARDFLQNKWNNKQEVCSKEDLLEIAKGQIELENLKIKKSSKLIFCDTNILTTISWSKTHFNGFCDPWIQRKARTLKYHYYLILNTDVPWVNDDLRDRPINRKKMFLAHKKELDYASVDYDIINGTDFQKRLYAAIDYIKNKF